MRMNNTIAFIDVDGILLDFDKLAVRTINRVYGLNAPENHKPLTWGYEELMADLPPEVDRNQWFNEMDENWARWMEAYEGAADFLRDLRATGARVIILTAIPQKFVVDRLACLNMHGFEYDEFYAVPYGTCKSDYINLIMERFPDGQHIFLDDKGANVVSVAINGPMAAPERNVTLDHPFNTVEAHADNEEYVAAVERGLVTFAPTLVAAYEQVLLIARENEGAEVLDPVVGGQRFNAELEELAMRQDAERLEKLKVGLSPWLLRFGGVTQEWIDFFTDSYVFEDEVTYVMEKWAAGKTQQEQIASLEAVGITVPKPTAEEVKEMLDRYDLVDEELKADLIALYEESPK